VTIVFGYLLRPFFAPILWACIISVLFQPVQGWLERNWGHRPSLNALITLTACVFLVVIPALLLLTSFIQQGIAIGQQINAGEIQPARYLDQIRAAFPVAQALLERLDIQMDTVRQNATGLAVSEVARATVKGNLVVALVQGALGGIIFWVLGFPAPLLWGAVMAVLSLIPAVGAGLVWLPATIYLYAVGEWITATVLLAYGVVVIGLADNILRPILVGRDTKLPDWMVLLSTLGGLSLFGINGFVLGPLIAVLFIAFWQIFGRERSEPVVEDEPPDSLPSSDSRLAEHAAGHEQDTDAAPPAAAE
jgi:predicted PurR-regulated permease PerM